MIQRQFHHRFSLLLCFVLSTVIYQKEVLAQPSSEATGPTVVLNLAPTGDDVDNGGATTLFDRLLQELKAIAARDPEARVLVQLTEGVFRIERPIEMERVHVPAQGSVTFQGAGAAKTTVSGGELITGWERREDGLWHAKLQNSGVATQGFRELFVGGQRQPRARHPNVGYLRIDAAFPDKRTGFSFHSGDLPAAWTAGGELVFLHDWSLSRIPIASVDHDQLRLTVSYPIGNSAPHFKIDHFEAHPRYVVENQRVFLDAPGEWWLDEEQGELYYYPRETDVLNKTEFVAPRALGLLVVRGSVDEPIRNVHFERIGFQHCAWEIPVEGYAGIQATAHERRDGSARSGNRNLIPPALLFELAEDCSFTHGAIEHLGTSGIEFGSRTRRCRLEDSQLEDISGNGVNLGEDTGRGVTAGAWWQAAPDEVATGHVVTHNSITNCGSQYYGAVAVWGGIVREMEISHNLIANHPYTGVSLGWMWNPTPTPARENMVRENHIHHVMQVLSDGGGIYTLGKQPGTQLTGNLIHDVPLNAGRAESNGMFIDEGSDELLIADNTIYAIDKSPLRFHRAQSVQVQRNLLGIKTSDTPALMYNSTNPTTIEQEDNQVLTAEQLQSVRLRAPAVGPRP
jgi:hypothetical protein